jgi:hypothetical protein
MASGEEYQLWARPAMDAVNANESTQFNLIHMESQAISLIRFMDVTIPVIPSWHGVM